MANNDSSITAFFGGDTSGLEKAVDRATTVVGSFQSALGKIGLTIGAAAVVGFFKSVIDHAGKLNDLSESTGASTDAIQGFSHAVRLAGGQVEDAGRVLQNVRNKVDELAIGNKEATKSFAQLGLSQKDLVGIPLEQALEKIAKAYVANKDQAGAYSGLIDIVGNKSAKLMAVLEDLGANGFGTLEARARDAGQMIEGQLIRQLDEAGDRLEEMKGRLIVGGSEVLGFFDKVAQGLGAMAAVVVNWSEGIDTAHAKGAVSAQKAEAAIVKVTEAIKGQQGTVKDFIAFNEGEAKREMERLEMRGDRQGKINAMLALANQYLAEAAGYGENTKEQLEFIAKANAVVLEVDKERAKTAKEHSDVMDKLGELAFERLETDERITKLAAEEKEIVGNIEQMKRDGVDTSRAELALAETRKKLDAERQESAERHVRNMDRLKELQMERLTAEQKAAVLASEIAEITRNIVLAKSEGRDTTQMEVGLMETQNKLAEVGAEISQDQLKMALEKTELTQEEVEAVMKVLNLIISLKPPTKAVTDEVIDQAAAWDKVIGRVKVAKDEVIKMQGVIAGIGTSKNFGNEDTAVLEEMMRRNRKTIAQLQFQDAGEPDGRKFNRGEIARLEIENQNLKKEIDLRNMIAGVADRQGMDAARRIFPGDPRAFDRFVTLAEGQDVTQKLVQKDIGDIKTILRDTFGR
jgi:hypothetical protein